MPPSPPHRPSDDRPVLENALFARVLELIAERLTPASSPGKVFDIVERIAGAGDWCERLSLGASALGLRATVVDGRPNEVVRALGRSAVAVLHAGDGRWMLIRAHGAHRVEVVTIDALGESRVHASAIGGLARTLGTSTIQCVVVEPWFPLEALSQRAIAGVELRPWRRLRAFIALDRRDIWGVIVYAVIIGTLALATPIAVQVLVNTIALGAVLQPLVVMLVVLTGGLAFAALLRVLEAFVIEVLQRRVFVRVAEDFGRRIPALGWTTHRTLDMPVLTHRFFDVLTVQKTMSVLFVDGLTLVLQTASGMLLLAFYHPFLLAFDLALVGLLIVVLIMGRGAVASASAESAAKYETAAWLHRIASHPELFLGERGAERAAMRTAALCRAYLSARRTHFRVLLRQMIGGLGLYVFCTVALLGIGGWLVIRGQLTLGQLVAAELVIAALASGFTKLGKNLEKTYDLAVGVKKISDVVDLAPERQGGVRIEGQGPARLELVDLGISAGGRRLIDSLSIEMKPGARVRVAGPSGSGKTLLLEALAGRRPPSAGRLSVDGIDMERIDLRSWRDDVVFVRGLDLFPGSVLDNLQSGPDRIEEAQARPVLRILGLEPVIDRLPLRLDARLGPGGAPLSETQARRLVLARAVLARPRLLLLDRALDGLQLGERELDLLLGNDAPWTAVVVTDDPRVARRCAKAIDLPGEEIET